jgi:hypothetical protein
MLGDVLCDDYSDPDIPPDEPDLVPTTQLPVSIVSAIHQADRFTLSPAAFDRAQTEITPSVRAAAVDWLVRVTLRADFQMATLFKAIHFLDEIFSREAIPRARVHRLSATCLCVSAKIEENLLCHSLGEFITICHNEFGAPSFRSEEFAVVRLMKGQMTVVTPELFVAPLLSAIGAKEVEKAAQFWAIVSLYDHSLIAIPAPLIAISAIIGAMGSSCPFEQLYALVPEGRKNEKVLGVMKKLLTIARTLAGQESNAIRDHYHVEEIERRVEVMDPIIRELQSRH